MLLKDRAQIGRRAGSRRAEPFLPKVAASNGRSRWLCALLGALQTWMTVDIIDDAWYFAPIANALFGIVTIACASRARRWAAIAVLVGCAPYAHVGRVVVSTPS